MSYPVHFESTIWTVIKKAKEKEENALNQFINRYKSSIAGYLLRKGASHQDIEDLTQEVFLRIFKDEVLSRADQAKGRFRALLLVVTKHVFDDYLKRELSQKRGGEVKKIDLEEIDEILVSKETDEIFDEEWVQNLIYIASERLKDQSPGYYEAIKLYIDYGGDYKIMSEKLGKDEKTTRDYFYKAKARLVKEIHHEIARYSSSNQEYNEEINHLSRFFI